MALPLPKHCKNPEKNTDAAKKLAASVKFLAAIA